MTEPALRPTPPSTGSPTTPRLQLLGIGKRYPAVIANADVNLSVMRGEIHAVLGENGAGKSTLMKIIYGVTRPDQGEILWEGRPVEIASPAAARRLGIGMVFQHFSLFETLSVVENISLALDERLPLAALAERIATVSQAYGLPLDPHRLVHSMSMGERQRVEIVRCLLQGPRLLIMDEPTSVLTPQAVLTLFESLRRLAAEGCSILYISHKLDEIQSLCDKATVLRAGRVSGTAIPAQESARSLAELMIGRELPACRLAARAPGAVRLAVRDLRLPSQDPFGTDLKGIDLEVRSGEILGIAGIAGNGQQELLRALCGEVLVPAPGGIRIDGQDAGHLRPAERRRLGMTYVPEDRLGSGAVPDLSLAANALLTGYRDGMTRNGLIRFGQVHAFARRVIERFNVKCAGDQTLAGSLSGGNLQRFIVGREILLNPRVMIAAQPTWGVDIGAAMLIRQAIIDLRDQGVAVLVVSEELDELFMISDRIAVLADGRLSRAVPAARTNVQQVGIWMGGNFTAAAGQDAAAQPVN